MTGSTGSSKHRTAAMTDYRNGDGTEQGVAEGRHRLDVSPRAETQAELPLAPAATAAD